MHVWSLPEDNTQKLREAATQLDLPAPHLLHTLDVNALNYCRFSLMPLDKYVDGSRDAYVAVPNLVESSLVSLHLIVKNLDLTFHFGTDGHLVPPDYDPPTCRHR